MSRIRPPSPPSGTKAKAKQGKSTSDKKLEDKYAALLEDHNPHNAHDAGEESSPRKRKHEDERGQPPKKEHKDNSVLVTKKKEDLKNRPATPRRDTAIPQRRRVDAKKNVRPTIEDEDDENNNYFDKTDEIVEMEAFFGDRQKEDELEDEEENWEEDQDDDNHLAEIESHVSVLDIPTDMVLESGFERNKKIISLLEDFSHRPQEDKRNIQDIEDEKAIIKEVLEKMFKQSIDGMRTFSKDMRQHHTFGRVANLCKHALSALAHDNIKDAQRLVKIIIPKKG